MFFCRLNRLYKVKNETQLSVVFTNIIMTSIWRLGSRWNQIESIHYLSIVTFWDIYWMCIKYYRYISKLVSIYHNPINYIEVKMNSWLLIYSQSSSSEIKTFLVWWFIAKLCKYIYWNECEKLQLYCCYVLTFLR